MVSPVVRTRSRSIVTFERPDLSDDRIVAAIRQHFGLQTTLTFLPLGLDVLAWRYRAATADAAYFLKLRRGVVNEAALRVPRYLADGGVTHVVAPLATRAGRLWGDVDGFTLTLYPFITGATGMAHGLEERHWVAYGAALREIHDTPLTPDLARTVTREAFTIAQLFRRLRQAQWADVVAALEAHVASQTSPDDGDRELAAFWREKRGQIEGLVDRFEALGRQLRAARPSLVLCHSDVHPNNVVIDTEDHLWIVDWDDTLIAPRECDLMMGVGGLGNYPAGPRETAWFLRGYGSTVIDPVALAYYRHARALGDIGTLIEQAVLLPGADEATRHSIVTRLRKLFEPGYIVSLADEVDRFAT